MVGSRILNCVKTDTIEVVGVGSETDNDVRITKNLYINQFSKEVIDENIYINGWTKYVFLKIISRVWVGLVWSLRLEIFDKKGFKKGWVLHCDTK